MRLDRLQNWGYYVDELKDYGLEIDDNDIISNGMDWLMLADSGVADWVDISNEEGEHIGFIIIQTKSLPDCMDYYIGETFLRRKYRHHGLMLAVIKDYLSTHKGVYGLHILDKNYPAKAFWHKVEKELNLRPCPLLAEPIEEGVTLYGFINE